MSLREYAEREMRLAGLYDPDADYDGALTGAVLALVEAHVAQGHSGASHVATLEIFNKVINYKPLTPINSDPATWNAVGPGMWQSSRQPSVFSRDGGKTWYDIDAPEAK